MQISTSALPPDFLNREMFDQLLELEGEDPGFLNEIVATFISQGSQTLESLLENLNLKKLEEISRLGHLLKGASAALGLSLLAGTCERIQYLGRLKDGKRDLLCQEAIAVLKIEIQLAQKQFQMAKEFLTRLKDSCNSKT